MVECTGLENRRRATYRGFESHPLRHFAQARRSGAGQNDAGVDENEVDSERSGEVVNEVQRREGQSHPLRHFAQARRSGVGRRASRFGR